MDWTVDGLRKAGFKGFVTFPEVAALVDDAPGVYVVVRTSQSEPVFTDTTVGGRYRGRDSAYSRERVADEWVPGAVVVYIGKADARKTTTAGLAKRLEEYRRFGLGKTGHGGGRMIWQLKDHARLLVGWRAIGADSKARDLEDELILDFMQDHGGRTPFANVALPSRAARARRCLR
ncbi:hypothetical protein NY551_03470 [Curtobacterium flaccumfaciens pv. oortii]|uniref:hypothetical protein n=1 Tax=Curtobacterium flaccumfaciens TaxID=2035 RepID=UPI00265AB38C|nr:hypothetical protein [Curtobacterium flaccumfaciens]MCS5521792.1 hypothetical protein [Curtobacterium flaccumfaciens pv. oortii]